MSGIVGIFERNEAPIDRGLLCSLAAFLSYRGPDGLEVWSDGPVGFGHTMLRTTRESAQERQPMGLDGRFWITADARIDCRCGLTTKLEDAGSGLPRTVTDPELILRAYALWGENCVDHLRGDFSFAIWDVREKRLFCARDHFGIKPFYYAEIASTFIFSNTLNCVRSHPAVTDELNDDVILDFLIVGLNCDNRATAFQAVQRLPPAHCMTISTEGIYVRPYWSMPADGRIRYRSGEEYVEHFQALLRESVADRMRSERLGIFLSGGLDSSSIAAAAREIASTIPDLRAYTVGYQSLIPDDEGSLAQETAQFLRIPFHFQAFDNIRPFDRWDGSEIRWPEPIGDPLFAGLVDQFAMVAADRSVVLNGHGGDDVMHFQMWPYVQDLFRRREWERILADGSAFLRARRFPWLGLIRRTQKVFGRGPLAPVLPVWLPARWSGTLDAESRWRRTAIHDAHPHPVLPKARAALTQPVWTFLFEVNDPGVTGFPVEVRYPFFDLRLVCFLLSLPPFPWFFHKFLLRRAMAGRLPPRVLARPKTPLAGDPLVEHVKRGSVFPMANLPWSDEMDRYVDRSKVPPFPRETSSERLRLELRPFCLNSWLLATRSACYHSPLDFRNL